MKQETTFENCTCVMAEVAPPGGLQVAQQGHCDTGCSQLYLFCVFFFLSILTTFMQSVPGITISLRCGSYSILHCGPPVIDMPYTVINLGQMLINKPPVL